MPWRIFIVNIQKEISYLKTDVCLNESVEVYLSGSVKSFLPWPCILYCIFCHQIQISFCGSLSVPFARRECAVLWLEFLRLDHFLWSLHVLFLLWYTRRFRQNTCASCSSLRASLDHHWKQIDSAKCCE